MTFTIPLSLFCRRTGVGDSDPTNMSSGPGVLGGEARGGMFSASGYSFFLASNSHCSSFSLSSLRFLSLRNTPPKQQQQHKPSKIARRIQSHNKLSPPGISFAAATIALFVGLAEGNTVGVKLGMPLGVSLGVEEGERVG